MKIVVLLSALFCAVLASSSFAGDGPGDRDGGGTVGNGGGGCPFPAPSQPAACTPGDSYSTFYKEFNTEQEGLRYCFCPGQVQKTWDAWYGRYFFICNPPEHDHGGNG